jgi:hypothetical protein
MTTTTPEDDYGDDYGDDEPNPYTEPLLNLQGRYEEVKTTLEQIVATQPDFVYEPISAEKHGATCLYAYNDAPSCVVGHLCHTLGLSVAQLEFLDDASEILGDTGIGAFFNQGTILADRRTETLLREVQQYQDSGATWGEALSHAVKYVEEHVSN